MKDKPKSQRLQRLLNKNDFDTLDEKQCIELIKLLRKETEFVVRCIKENAPFKIDLKDDFSGYKENIAMCFYDQLQREDRDLFSNIELSNIATENFLKLLNK